MSSDTCFSELDTVQISGIPKTTASKTTRKYSTTRPT
jgi:hypothetical protein